MARRFGKDGIGYRHCPYFYSAIKKYGWNNFTHELLEDNIKTKLEADEREKYYINLYNSTNPEFGYNIQKGGNDQSAVSKHVYQYDLNGNYLREWNSIIDATRECYGASKISECCNGKRKSSGGFMWSFEKKESIAPYKQKSKSKPVYQYSIDGTFINKFNSVVEASKILGVDKNNIVAACNIGQQTAYGYQWSYNYSDKIDAIDNPTKNQTHEYKPILQIDKTGSIVQKYESLNDMVNHFNGDKKLYSKTYRCLIHKAKFSQGYIWLYEDEFDNFDLNNYIQYKNLMKEVQQYDLNMNYIQTFKSVSDASKVYNANGYTSDISACANSKRQSAYGYIWKYAETNNNQLD